MRQCKELPFVVKQKRGPHIGNRNLEGTVINKKKTCGIEVIGAIHLNVQRFWMGGEEWVVIKCIQRLELLRLRAARSSWKTSRAPGKREASRSLCCNALASTVPDIPASGDTGKHGAGCRPMKFFDVRTSHCQDQP